MLMPDRKYSAGSLYRYGFNGKENDNNVNGEGNEQDYGMRIYDPRICRWLSVDQMQIKHSNESPYLFVGGNPMIYTDPDGRDRILTLSIQHPDGTVTQIRKRYVGEYHYHQDAAYETTPIYYKNDIEQNISITESSDGQTWKDAMNDPSKVLSIEVADKNYYDVSPLEYYWNVVTSILPNVGDESDKTVANAWRVYGNNTNTDWEDGLPQAGPGTESVDLGEFLDYLGNLAHMDVPGSPSASDVAEAIAKKFGNGKKFVDVLKKIETANDFALHLAEQVQKTQEAAKKELDKLKTEPGTPDSAICRTCLKPQDSTHIDQVNGAGAFDKAKADKKTKNTKSGP
ncbi:MAG: RHS repeat-associated core domain-containing protein [Ferruginibacter sp.]